MTELTKEEWKMVYPLVGALRFMMEGKEVFFSEIAVRAVEKLYSFVYEQIQTTTEE